MNIEVIIFDCMETLIHLEPLPSKKDYAFWAFSGSGIEKLWHNFEYFYSDYIKTEAAFAARQEPYEEHSFYERFYAICERNTFIKSEQTESCAKTLAKQLWDTYSSYCYAKNEVPGVIRDLSESYTCGVLSNFKIAGGIEELLAAAGLYPFLSFILTSVDIGWRKPHQNMYLEAIKRCNKTAHKILIVGDDFDCDYAAPKKFGMQSLLLDPENNYSHIPDRISSLTELQLYL